MSAVSDQDVMMGCAVQPSLEDLDDKVVSKILQLGDYRIHGVASSCSRFQRLVRSWRCFQLLVVLSNPLHRSTALYQPRCSIQLSLLWHCHACSLMLPWQLQCTCLGQAAA
jgi:hypothetical protein